MRVGIDASRAFVDQLTGTERYAYEMITRMLALPEAGKHEWILYVKKGQTGDNKYKMSANVRVVEIPLPYLWTQAGLAVRTWIDKLDVLWVPAHTLPVFRKPGLVTMVTIHGIEYEWLPAYESFLQRWYLPLSTIYAVRTATKVIAVSKFTKDQLVKRLKAREEKIEVIGEGFGPQTKNEKDKVINRDKILAEYHLKRNRYLMFVGTVQPRKNLERFIEAFSRLKDTDYKLVICGKLGWNYDGVLAAAEKAGKGRVVITGYTDDTRRLGLLSGAAAYVQPSITEGFGLPVLEAMEAGVPVVSSNGGALPELVGEAGLLFDPFDVREMTEKLELIINDRNLRERLKKKGKGQISKYQWGRSAEKVFKLLTYKI